MAGSSCDTHIGKVSVVCERPRDEDIESNSGLGPVALKTFPGSNTLTREILARCKDHHGSLSLLIWCEINT